MLQIKDIRKQYVTGDLVQTALDGVSMTLRDNEFVAVLGPSGSGKTTLLNVIGGLDRYDSGDLVINGISTKKYSDRDWDSYRNHTIGFVFQSYNLIPHQTVLANVELALTISGISRSERRKRAKKALEDVGLGNQLHKKPNQMSGGQMQRVAIARALVNNPDILLADEPTGALDSDTSVQVMELLKEVSKDRLVVMVTHNPELAEEYANRIVRVRDGKIIDDSNPYFVDTAELEPPKHKNMGRSSMSFFTALALSFNNLRTKKARTLLTAFAGSIGIIGIALILSLSTGFQRYIDQIQEDTLSNYPLSIQSETADMTAAFVAIGSALNGTDAEPGTVIEQQMISQMFAQVGSNDLGAFKAYLEDNMDQVADTINAIKYSYSVKPLIYSADTDEILQVNPGSLFEKITGNSAMSAYMDSDIFYEMLDNTKMLDSQYDVLRGRWPEHYNEMVVVLSDPNQITDYMAYTLGLKDMSSLDEMLELVMNGQQAKPAEEPMQWTYEDLMDLRFRLVPPSAKYQYNAEYNVWEDLSGNTDHLRSIIESGDELRIVGIVCPKEGVSATALSPGIAYTSGLTQRVIGVAADSQIVANQLADMNLDVFTGKPFGAEDEESGLNFDEMISIDSDMLSSAFGFNINESAIFSMLENYMAEIGDSILEDSKQAQSAFADAFAALATDMLQQFISENASAQTGEAVITLADSQALIDSYLSGQSAAEIIQPLVAKYSVTAEGFTNVYRPLLMAMLTGYVASHMSEAEAPEVPDLTLPTVPETETEPSVSPLSDMEATEPTAATEATEPAESSESTEPSEPSDAELPEIDLEQFSAVIKEEDIPSVVYEFTDGPIVTAASAAMANRMTQGMAQDKIAAQLASFGNRLMQYMGSSLQVDQDKIASAFQFEMNEEELRRLMQALSGANQQRDASSNLRALGYADIQEPSAISIYLVDFAGKERFLDFLDRYNADMESAGQEEQVISYTDMTGILMSSVRTIIDSVSYVLIAFVAVSLVVSSIMIGIITYISVMERTKEIGVLRAIGASKRNISQVFNAETFIIGLCSGLIGVGITLLLIFPINDIIHSVTENHEINAQLPPEGAVILILLSMVLTLIGGLIPSRKAAKKDPVIALRSE